MVQHIVCNTVGLLYIVPLYMVGKGLKLAIYGTTFVLPVVVAITVMNSIDKPIMIIIDWTLVFPDPYGNEKT